MKAIQLNRAFLRKPLNSVLILLSVVALIEALSWSIGFQIKSSHVTHAGGLLLYITKFVRVVLLPELGTLFITIALINWYHKWFCIKHLQNSWRSVGRYELQLLPVIALSFLVFNPITQTVRYLLGYSPNSYSFSEYWHDYMLGTFTWSNYFQYLFPVVLLSYLIVNISLFKDFLQQRREAQEAAEVKAVEAEQAALQAAQAARAAAAKTQPQPSVANHKSPYLMHLKGKNGYGELDFPVTDAYYFTIEDRSYYVELPKGRYQVVKTLNELEAELDPSQFFRIKRDYVVNRHAVLSYAYWENGKYIVRLNTPDRYEIVVPRARMQEFREWLQSNQQPLTTDGSTDSLLLEI